MCLACWVSYLCFEESNTIFHAHNCSNGPHCHLCGKGALCCDRCTSSNTCKRVSGCTKSIPYSCDSVDGVRSNTQDGSCVDRVIASKFINNRTWGWRSVVVRPVKQLAKTHFCNLQVAGMFGRITSTVPEGLGPDSSWYAGWERSWEHGSQVLAQAQRAHSAGVQRC